MDTTPIVDYHWEICTYGQLTDCVVNPSLSQKKDGYFWERFSLGTHRITLTVTDELGLTGSTSLEVDVTKPWPSLPQLGSGTVIDSDSSSVIKTAFKGGISLQNEELYKIEQDEQNLALIRVDILGEIRVDAKHVGQLADILALIYMEKLDRGFPLDLELQVSLKSTQQVRMIPYEGNLPSDTYRVYFGYRLSDGTRVYNGEKQPRLTIH